MPKSDVHQCECPHCQEETNHAEQELHRQMNLLLSRLDEQQRRWLSDQSSGYDCQAEVAHAQKKRPNARRRSGGVGAARNGGRPDE
jgi:hypothetical protein